MAKNRNRHRRDRSPNFASFHVNSQRVRDAFDIASDFDRTFEPVSRSLPSHVDVVDDFQDIFSTSVRSMLPQIEDRRTYHPADFDRPVAGPRGVTKFKNVGSIRSVMTFGLPKHALVCVRRHLRKEVLHALGKTGRGSSPPRRFNQFSKVRC